MYKIKALHVGYDAGYFDIVHQSNLGEVDTLVRNNEMDVIRSSIIKRLTAFSTNKPLEASHKTNYLHKRFLYLIGKFPISSTYSLLDN